MYGGARCPLLGTARPPSRTIRNALRLLAAPSIPWVAGEEGRFSFVTIGSNGVAYLWTKQDEDDGSHDQGVLQCSELAKLGSKRTDLVFFAESRGALLVEQGSAFSIVDLKSKEKMTVHLKDERIELVELRRLLHLQLALGDLMGKVQESLAIASTLVSEHRMLPLHPHRDYYMDRVKSVDAYDKVKVYLSAACS